MTEEVQQVSRVKEEAWVRLMKKPDDPLLKAQYQQLKTSPGRLQMRYGRHGGKSEQKRLRN